MSTLKQQIHQAFPAVEIPPEEIPSEVSENAITLNSDLEVAQSFLLLQPDIAQQIIGEFMVSLMDENYPQREEVFDPVIYFLSDPEDLSFKEKYHSCFNNAQSDLVIQWLNQAKAWGIVHSLNLDDIIDYWSRRKSSAASSSVSGFLQ